MRSGEGYFARARRNVLDIPLAFHNRISDRPPPVRSNNRQWKRSSGNGSGGTGSTSATFSSNVCWRGAACSKPRGRSKPSGSRSWRSSLPCGSGGRQQSQTLRQCAQQRDRAERVVKSLLRSETRWREKTAWLVARRTRLAPAQGIAAECWFLPSTRGPAP